MFANRNSASSSRTGFSLVELIVVTAIVAVILAIALPAVQSVRESARRSQCRNNLKQFGLAMQAYHESHRCFPIGNVPGSNFTAQAQLLPFLDLATLHAELMFDVGGTCFSWKAGLPADRDPGRIVASVFGCPSDPYSGSTAAAFSSTSGLHVPTNYLGVSGTSPIEGNGLLYSGSSVRMGELIDGTSSTLMIGERGIPATLDRGWSLCAFGAIGDGEGDNVLSAFEGLTPGDSNGLDNEHFWSHHRGGAHFALADGSVKFLNEYLDQSLFTSLASRNGMEVATLPQ